MKSLFSILCAVLIFSATAEENSNFIVGGEDSLVRDHPYMAGVLNFNIPTCGGTINILDSRYELKIPAIVNRSIDCVWTLVPPLGGILTVNLK